MPGAKQRKIDGSAANIHNRLYVLQPVAFRTSVVCRSRVDRNAGSFAAQSHAGICPLDQATHLPASRTDMRCPERMHINSIDHLKSARSTMSAAQDPPNGRRDSSPRQHLAPASGTVLIWRLGGRPRSLWSLLMVCSQMGISPLHLVRGDIDKNDTNAEAPNAPVQHTRIDPVVIRHALVAVLASHQPPPPSMRPVADRLGQTSANLHHYFPELCRTITSRHRSYEQARGARTRTRLRETVRDAAIALTHRAL